MTENCPHTNGLTEAGGLRWKCVKCKVVRPISFFSRCWNAVTGPKQGGGR